MRLRNAVIGIIVVVIILPALLLAGFLLSFDPNQYAPDIAAAVQNATGRNVTFGGPIRLRLSLTPTIGVDGLALANPPGFADPNVVTVTRLDAKIALLPLLSHRLDILDLVLVNPVITLESNSSGAADWDFAPAAPTPGAGGPPGPAEGYKAALEAVDIQGGAIVIKTASGTAANIAVQSMSGNAASLTAPLNVTAQASYNNVPFTLAGTLGPVARFFGRASGAWPLNLTLASNGATAAIQGGIAHPRTGRGYDFTMNATVPALEAFAAVLPPGALAGQALPPIHGITASAKITDQNARFPAISHLLLHAGASDLSTLRPGLALTSLDVAMPSLTAPVTLNLAGTAGSAPVALSGTIGPVAALLNPAWLPAGDAPAGSYPVALQAQLADAKLSLTGGISNPANAAGVALTLNATAPDLSHLNPVAGFALPAWKNMSIQTSILDPGGAGLFAADGLDGLVVSMDNAAFGGDASLFFATPDRLQLALKGQKIDLDALLAAMPAAPAPAGPPAPAPASAAPAFVVPTAKLPLSWLKLGNADIQLSADEIIVNHATYTALQAHALVNNGVFTINPLTAVLPGGGVAVTATLDSTKEPAAAAITINAPALALSPFLKALSLPDTAEGTINAQLNATATGDDPHDLLATVNGQLGLAAVNGVVDGTVLDSLFGAVLRAVDLPEAIIGAQGPVPVRCFGLRMDAMNGVGTIRALTLDSSRLLVQGGGDVNFATESYGVIIRPELQIAGNAVGLPVEIGGTFAAPTTGVAPLAAVQDAAKTALGLPVSLVQQVVGNNTVLNNIATKLGVNAGGDVCPAALALGRLGQPGPAAAPLPAAGSTGAAPSSGPKNLLNLLFGK
jgi:AsmA protein